MYRVIDDAERVDGIYLKSHMLRVNDFLRIAQERPSEMSRRRRVPPTAAASWACHHVGRSIWPDIAGGLFDVRHFNAFTGAERHGLAAHFFDRGRNHDACGAPSTPAHNGRAPARAAARWHERGEALGRLAAMLALAGRPALMFWPAAAISASPPSDVLQKSSRYSPPSCSQDSRQPMKKKPAEVIYQTMRGA